MARRFIGTTDWLNFGSVGLPLGFTFGAWIRLDDASVSYNTAITYDKGGAGGDSLKFYIRSSGLTAAYVSGSALWDSTDTITVSVGAWNHFVIRISPANNSLYVNGVLSIAVGGGMSIGSFQSLNIGDDTLTSHRPDLSFADCAIWAPPITLSTAEMKALASGNIRANEIRPRSLAGYWPLNEPGSGSVAIDQSGNGHTGIPAGTAFTVDPPLLKTARKKFWPGIDALGWIPLPSGKTLMGQIWM
jgi:hypothetical protein